MRDRPRFSGPGGGTYRTLQRERYAAPVRPTTDARILAGLVVRSEAPTRALLGLFVCALHRDGWTLGQLRTRYRCARASVQRWLRAGGPTSERLRLAVVSHALAVAGSDPMTKANHERRKPETSDLDRFGQHVTARVLDLLDSPDTFATTRHVLDVVAEVVAGATESTAEEVRADLIGGSQKHYNVDTRRVVARVARYLAIDYSLAALAGVLDRNHSTVRDYFAVRGGVSS